MNKKVGIRREDMYAWERRVPLVPQDVQDVVKQHGLEIVVQSSDKRVFTASDYERAGIEVVEDLSSCSVMFGIKEVPMPVLEPEKTYIFFSHTIKGQPYNMPMLQKILDLKCTLIDYEKITDEKGRRLIFFGNFAGLAGMIDALWTFGRRLASEGIDNPFAQVKRAFDYPDLETAKDELKKIGERIATDGLPEQITPLVVGFAGYGNVSRGAQEILSLLPVKEISPSDLPTLRESHPKANKAIFKVVFKEQDMAEPLDSAHPFNLQEYYAHPEKFRGIFDRHLPYIDVLMNCIYWEPRYPRLLSKEQAREMYVGAQPRLRVIGDITCDIEGAIECTVKATEPDNPVFVYDPATDRAIDGVEGKGPVIMSVEILPTELPRESSTYFSSVLKKYVPAIASANYDSSFTDLDLPPEIKRAVIVHRGKLTPDYRYIEQYL
ncbi:MAG: bifunctional lysine ketoglutarate reductase /saccharopine dehydrogenase family protein [Candidatus Bipolaricaulota bacterium]|nr:bifunctional lysine ketoglutarate reductase /saccharopine dehydrogenase family protein [Candidatus Bipolaricaulota bacterium]